MAIGKGIFFFFCDKIIEKEKGQLEFGFIRFKQLKNMCTAIRFNNRYFGRTFDFERKFGESLLVVPRGKMPILESTNQYAIMGIGVIFEDTPLCFDGVNEWAYSGKLSAAPTSPHSFTPSKQRGVSSKITPIPITAY